MLRRSFLAINTHVYNYIVCIYFIFQFSFNFFFLQDDVVNELLDQKSFMLSQYRSPIGRIMIIFTFYIRLH